MNLLDNFLIGLSTAVQLQHLLLLLLGCVLGSLAGATRQVGMLAMLAMLLPVLQQIDILSALMTMIGVYCGANGGAVVASIPPPAAINEDGAAPDPGNGRLPGVGTGALPGYATPLVVLLAGLVGTMSIVVLAPLLIEQAFRFGPAEYFSLLAFGLTTFVVIGPGPLVKAMSTLVLGVMLSQLSVDAKSGLALFNFGLAELEPGIGLVPMAMGLAVVARVTATARRRVPGLPVSRSSSPRMSRFSFGRQWTQVLRGAVIGSLTGPAPGGGIQLGGHVALVAENRILRRSGAIGVDPIGDPAPAAAVVAAVRSSLVPMLAWGFPVNASLALMVGLMFGKQVVVGPQLMTGRPDLFWGSIAAVALTSVAMFVASDLFRRLAMKAGAIALNWLPAVMVVYGSVAVYALRNSAFDIFVMAAFAVLGHWLFKFGCRIGPMILGFVLGPALESNLRHALELSAGNWGVLVTRPISAGLLLAAAAVLCAVMLPSLRQRRARIFDLED